MRPWVRRSFPPLIVVLSLLLAGCSSEQSLPEKPQEEVMQSTLQQAAPPGMSAEDIQKLYGSGGQVDPSKVAPTMFPSGYPGTENVPRK
jgi:uncharacterized protein YcfL